MVNKVFYRMMCVVYILFLFAYTHFLVPHFKDFKGRLGHGTLIPFVNLPAALEEQSLSDLGICSLLLEVTLWVEMLSSARNRMPG